MEDPNRTTALQWLNCLVAWISGLTLLGMAVAAPILHLLGKSMPTWLEGWPLAILSSAAVGYLTNYLAIQMLFRPYYRHGIIPPGVIPRNKPRLARALGEQIPAKLLPPEKLAETVQKMMEGFLNNPSMVDRVVDYATTEAQHRAPEIAANIAPHVTEGILDGVMNFVREEAAADMANNAAQKMIQHPSCRKAVVDGVSSEMAKKAPEIALELKKLLKIGAQEAVAEKCPGMFRDMAMPIVNSIIDNLAWYEITAKIEDGFRGEEGRRAIDRSLDGLAEKVGEFLHKPEAREMLCQLMRDHRQQIATELQGRVEVVIADTMGKLAQKREMLQAAATKLIDGLSKVVSKELDDRAGDIVAGLNLSNRIEVAVNDMPVESIHDMVDKVSGRELVMLQLFGYLLGGIAGALLGVLL